MSDTQRMVLRRIDPAGAPSAATAAKRIEAAPDVELLDRASDSMLLVQGAPAAIGALIGDLSGWSASPVTSFARPQTRPSTLKLPDD